MVFAGVYPVTTDDYEDLRTALENFNSMMHQFHLFQKHQWHLGLGFGGGFLGMLHMEIVQERLEREFDMPVIVTVPNVLIKL